MRHLCLIFMPILITTGKNRYNYMFSKKLSIIAWSVLSLSILATSCKREKEDDTIINNESTGYAEEQLILEQIYSNADRVVDRALALGASALKGGEHPLGGCTEVKIDTTDNPDVDLMTIDFGGSGCLGYDGRIRTGKLLVYFANKVKDTESGYYRRTVFNMYTVDGHRVGGHREMWYNGTGTTGMHSHNIVSVDTIYLPNNTGKVTGSSLRTREWFQGVSTPQTADDIYRLTGSGNFIRPKGERYYVEIAKPLVDALNCNWINEGVTNVYPEGATQRVLDYGEGDCDNDAIINVNGVKRIAKIP